MIERILKNFLYGIHNSLEANSIPLEAASDALNFITQGDHIELRRGSLHLGTLQTGNGRITGLGVAAKRDGTQILFATFARKIKYYDETTSDFIEIGTNTLPSAASGEDVALTPYDSLAGAQLWLSSPNSSIYKIMAANPASITDLSQTTYRGLVSILANRMFLWQRKDDNTGLYLSYIDAANYTTVAGEATASLGGTLAFKGGGAKRTCWSLNCFNVDVLNMLTTILLLVAHCRGACCRGCP